MEPVVKPMFDPKYKTILEVKCKPDYINMLEWVNRNSSGSVDAKFEFGVGTGYGIEKIYLGFEDSGDALIFRIRYSV